jgi:hypothetical protein
MSTAKIIEVVESLPLKEKLLVIERAIQSIRTGRQHALEEGVSALYNDYKHDKELTVFTQLDTEDFYETR